MERASLEGVELAYELGGAGEPVVLIHHGAGMGLVRAATGAGGARRRPPRLTYHRAGYGESSRPAGQLDFAKEAAHCRFLFRDLGLEPARVVGH